LNCAQRVQERISNQLGLMDLHIQPPIDNIEPVSDP
jgi:hypothetical protein